jgi:hypothetical protein
VGHRDAPTDESLKYMSERDSVVPVDMEAAETP